MTPETQAPRRRRRSSRRGTRTTALGALGTPAANRAIHVAMLFAALVYVGFMLFGYVRSDHYYGGAFLHAAPSEILYGFGKPNLVRSGPDGTWMPLGDVSHASEYSQWAYATPGGGQTQIKFVDGAVSAVSCRHPEAQRFACPDNPVGLGVGLSEDDLALKLGRPSSESYDGSAKQVRYDDLGMSFTLRQFTIYSIGVSDADGSFGRWFSRFLFYLIP